MSDIKKTGVPSHVEKLVEKGSRIVSNAPPAPATPPSTPAASANTPPKAAEPPGRVEREHGA